VDTVAAVDGALDHVINATRLLTSPEGESFEALMSQYRLALGEYTAMRDEMMAGIPGVPPSVTERVGAAADAAAVSLSAMVDCYESSTSSQNECSQLSDPAGKDSNALGNAASDLVPYGSRTDSEVLDLLDAAQSPDDTTVAGTGEAVFSIDCDGTSYETYQEAWEFEYDWCDATLVSGVPSEGQREIAAVSVGKPVSKLSDQRILTELSAAYEMCAQSGPDNYEYFKADEVIRTEQLKSFKAMMMLCPDNPDAAEIKKRIKAVGGSLDGPRTIFGSGRFRVGKDIAPGTYVSSRNDEGCYWERLNRNGDIIDNNYTNGSRVQVTIGSSDFEFNSENCNTWKKP